MEEEVPKKKRKLQIVIITPLCTNEFFLQV